MVKKSKNIPLSKFSPSLTLGRGPGLNFICIDGPLYKKNSTPYLIRKEWNAFFVQKGYFWTLPTYLLTFNCLKVDSNAV